VEHGLQIIVGTISDRPEHKLTYFRYKNNIIGGKLWIWGGSALHFMKSIREVRYDHYDIRYWNRNMWAFLGNGRIEAEVTKDVSKLAPYMRNADVPWEL
jgi:hypothetical protein